MEPAPTGAWMGYFESGGPTIAVMAVCSIFVVALALERFAQIWSFRRSLKRLDERVVEAVRRGELDEARRLCEGVASPLREVLSVGLDRAMGRVKGEAATAMHREQKRAVSRLRSWVWILGTMGALMPFVGLFGTVVGVMASFQAIGESGAGGFAVVSAGISEALVATAAGLFVALEAVTLFNVLQSMIAALSRDLSLIVDETAEILRTRGAEVARTA